MSHSKLSKTFNLPTMEDVEDIIHDITVSIPDNPALRDIVKLALSAYKTQIESLNRIAPQYRTHAFEVAQLYLQSAKDAIEADRALTQKDQKLIHDLNKDDALPPGSKLLLEGGKTREQMIHDLSQKNRSQNLS